MKQWLIRCTALIAVAGILAVVHAGIEPLSIEHLERATRPRAQTPPPQQNDGLHSDGQAETHAIPHGPDEYGDVANLDWLVEHYEAGTALIVDARLRRQYREGHIPGAFHLEFGMFQSGMPDVVDILRAGLPIIIYCDGGDCDASHKVKIMLERYGLDDLYVFTPGWEAWEQAGLPVETGDPIF